MHRLQPSDPVPLTIIMMRHWSGALPAEELRLAERRSLPSSSRHAQRISTSR